MLFRLYLAAVLSTLSTISWCQDSLCYSDIDKIVSKIQLLKCSRLDTGSVSDNSDEKYKECFITDSTGKELLAFLSSATDKTYYSITVNYYFYNRSLIKVETGDWNGKKKINLQYFYYTNGKCQPFVMDKHLQALRIYYKRQAGKIAKDWSGN